MIKCYICKKEKEDNNFYKDRSRYTGFHNMCKDCERLFNREKRIRNIETYKRKDKKYYQLHKKEIAKKRKLNYNPKKAKAHWVISQALYKGVTKREEKCCICGGKSEVAHHNDYDKPLEVEWLCQKCHMRKHFGK